MPNFNTFAIIACVGLSVLSLLLSVDNPNEIDGDLVISGDFLLETPVEDDLRFPTNLISIKGASNQPDDELFLNDTYALAFSPSTMEQGFLSLQLPHARKAGTDLEFHFHWSNADSTEINSVIWCVEYTCQDIDGIFPPTSAGCTQDFTQGNAYQHLITPAVEITNTLGVSAMCLVRIYRDATNSLDNFTDDAYLLEFDVHIYKEKLGYNTNY